MKWIDGKTLDTYNLREEEIWEHVEEGRLTPYAERPRHYPHDPDEQKGVKRVLPTKQQELDYENLSSLRNRRGIIKSSLRRAQESIEDCRRAGSEEIILLEELEIKRSNLTQELDQINPKIAELESRLDPKAAWKNLDLTPEQQHKLINKLLESYYLKSEILKLVSRNQVSSDKKRQDQRDREAVQVWAGEYLDSLIQSNDEMPTLKDISDIAKEQLPAARSYAPSTLRDWIRPVHPRYTPRKRGRKKGSKIKKY